MKYFLNKLLQELQLFTTKFLKGNTVLDDMEDLCHGDVMLS